MQTSQLPAPAATRPITSKQATAIACLMRLALALGVRGQRYYLLPHGPERTQMEVELAEWEGQWWVDVTSFASKPEHGAIHHTRQVAICSNPEAAIDAFERWAVEAEESTP